MASTINAKNTSTGVVITPDASGQLELQTADTTRMTIDVNGNVGIGTTNPTSPLVLYRNSATSVSINLGNTVNSWLSGTDSSGNFANYTNGAYSYIVSTSGTERMRIDSSGRITTPFQPAFLASSSSGTHTTNIGNVLDFNLIYLDRTSNFNTSTYRFTAPTAGYYVFYFQVYTQNGATQKSICWRKNGSQVIVSSDAISYQGSVNISEVTISSSVIISLAAGDYVDVAVRTGSSNLQWFGGHSWLQGYLLG